MTNVNTTACVVVAFLALCGCGSDTDSSGDVDALPVAAQGFGAGAPPTGTTIHIRPSPPVFCASDASCNDGNACTIDHCMSGKCSHADASFLSSCVVSGVYGFCSDGSCCTGCLTPDTLTCVASCPDGLVCTMQHVCQ